MKIIKFGGKSLANGKGIKQVISIISQKYKSGKKLVIVVSARGNATNELMKMLEKAKNQHDYKNDLEYFEKYQIDDLEKEHFKSEFFDLRKLLEGVSLLGDYSKKIEDAV